MPNEWRRLERIIRGFSNHRRLQMLHLLTASPEQDLSSIASACGINFRTASEHTMRLVRAGLVLKRSKGRRVLHAVSPRGKAVLAFVRSLK
jgi:predicted transcriptional regulator